VTQFSTGRTLGEPSRSRTDEATVYRARGHSVTGKVGSAVTGTVRWAGTGYSPAGTRKNPSVQEESRTTSPTLRLQWVHRPAIVRITRPAIQWRRESAPIGR
jgi:hypothetical protein